MNWVKKERKKWQFLRKKKNLFWKKKQKKKLIKWCNELKINRKKNLLPLNTIWELYVIVTYAHVCEKNFIFREIWWKILSDNFFDENRKRIYYWAYDLFKWGMWSLIMRVQDLFRKKKKKCWRNNTMKCLFAFNWKGN